MIYIYVLESILIGAMLNKKQNKYKKKKGKRRTLKGTQDVTEQYILGVNKEK